VLAQFREFSVIEPRPAHGLRVQPEAERPDQVQRRAGVPAQPDHVAGVRRYLGLE
jgi:hypothetical protein